MNVEIVGGGPAGLYLAILLRKLDRGRRRPRPRAERARRDVRLRRRLQRGDARRAAGRRSRDAPRDHGHVRALGPHRHPLPGARAVVARPLVLGDRAQAAARDPAGTVPRARRRARVRRRGGGAAGRGPRGRRRRREQPPAAVRRLRDEGAAGGLEVRLVRHRPRLRRVHVRVPRDRARALQRARVPVRRADVDVHRRVPGAGVARGRARRAGRAGEPRVLRAAVRERAARARAVLEPVALARLPEDHERDLARGEPRHPRRRGAHGALLDRLGDEARDGGLDLARGRVGAPALGPGRRVRRLRARARAVRAAHAGRGERECRVLRADRELLAPRADPVRVQSADPERADHARDARCARPAVHARARCVVRRTRRLAAAGVLAVRAARRAVREPLRARRELCRSQRGGAHVSGGRDPTRGQDPAPPEPCRSTRRDPAAEPGRRPSAGRRLARRGTDEASIWAVRCDSRPAGRRCRPRRVRRRGPRAQTPQCWRSTWRTAISWAATCRR